MLSKEFSEEKQQFKEGLSGKQSVEEYLASMQRDIPKINWQVEYSTFDVMRNKDRENLSAIWTEAANSNVDKDTKGVYIFEEDKVKGSGLFGAPSCIIVLKWGRWEKEEKKDK